MAGLPGYRGKVSLGAAIIAEMGAWGITGQECEMIEDTQFRDTIKSYVPGRLDGGVVTFNGNYDPDNTEQTALHTAFQNKTEINNIRLYYDDVATYDNGFFFCETDVTCTVQSIDDLGVDQSGLGTIGFSLKVSGNLLKKASAVFDGIITFTSGTKRMTRTSGTSFITLGFSVSDILTVRGSTNNNGEFTITEVLSTYLTVSESVTTENDVADVELISVT